MATNIAKNAFVDYDGKTKVNLDKIYVEYQYSRIGETKRIPIKNLYIQGGKSVKTVDSYKEFVKNLSKNKITLDVAGLQSIKEFSSDVKIKALGVQAPEKFTTISVNSQHENLPYGLQRTLQVQESSDSTADGDKYYYVKINGKDEFLQPGSIYFYDKSNKKKLLSEIKNLENLEDVQLFAPDGKKIDFVYTEKQYTFPVSLKTEQVNAITGEKIITEKTKSVGPNGEETYVTNSETQQLDRYYSEQRYVRKVVADDKRPGKTIEKSLIEIKNFQMQPDGEYFAISIDGNVKMVNRDEILDEFGNKIQDLSQMVGKSIAIKDGSKLIKSQPLTYEQANIAYSTIKNFAETEKDANENTYIRLKNGEYVKELESCKPISYKLVTLNNADYDAFLVKTVGADGNEKFVIVSKEYFKKHGDSTELKRKNSVRIKRCEFDSKDCVVVQTTSRGEMVEQCALVKKIKLAENDVAEDAKEVAEAGVREGYLRGDYKFSSVYHNGNLEEVSASGRRYEQTETSYLTDYADKLHQYRSLKNNEMRIVNGKFVGGPTFNVGQGIKDSYIALGNVFGSMAGIVFMSGIFVPVVGPIACAAFAVGSAAAVPAIPVLNAVYGAIKNSKRTRFMDKAEFNQKANQKDIEKRMEKLYERMTSKDYVPYPEARFEDEYSKLVNDIIALSTCTVDNKLIVKDGVAQVTPENANAAKAYMQEFNEVVDLLKVSNKKTTNAKNEFARVDAKMKKLEEEGKIINPKFQKKYDKLKKEYLDAKHNNEELSARHESLMNYQGNPTEQAVHAERDRMLKVASVMRTAVYFKTFKDNPVVKEAIEGKHGLTDCSDLLTDEDLSLEEKTWSEQEILEYRDRKAKQSVKMLNSAYMDFKNGLMVDGVGIGLNDEDVSRTPGYERGYLWAKVKQAFEHVHNTLNPKAKPAVNIDEPIYNTNDVDNGKDKQEEKAKVVRTKLTADNLERLLRNIELLKTYDDLYYTAEENIPSDLEVKIGKLEEIIERDKHLLSRAMKNKLNKYHTYKERIINAEAIIKNHRISNANQKNIRITV